MGAKRLAQVYSATTALAIRYCTYFLVILDQGKALKATLRTLPVAEASATI
jgi:hypothetical protein